MAIRHDAVVVHKDTDFVTPALCGPATQSPTRVVASTRDNPSASP
jgi:predicted nuclease of predicted toxin-antitoxin system